jgi:single-stranded DNA-specific DHH superfamily exonuclease
LTRLSTLRIENFIRDFHSVPDDSNPTIIGIHPKDIFIGLSNWGNAKCVFTKKLLTAIENKFGVHFEYIEPADEQCAIARFSR